LTGLTTLIVSGNALSALPDIFGSLPRLRNLEAARNRIEEVPDSVAQLTGLQVRKEKGEILEGRARGGAPVCGGACVGVHSWDEAFTTPLTRPPTLHPSCH
jgi:hypothetical protein